MTTNEQLKIGRSRERAAGGARRAARFVKPSFGAVVGAWLRRRLWRFVFFCTGGVTVRGRLPRGGCVVVANHSSHADAAALLAAVDARHATRVAAAADYWFAHGPRSLVCAKLAAGFPVRRRGGGHDDLQEEALPLLRSGHAVVVFPEGTRGNGDYVKRFQCGALRLADNAGVPVVPVALCGTAQLLPKNSFLRPGPVEVRVGTPLRNPDGDTARAAVVDLAEGYRERDSRLRYRLACLAVSRWGLVLAAVWSFAEALSWPLLPELLLAVLCVAAPRAGVRLTATAAVASVIGGTLALLLYAGTPVTLPQPLTTAHMHAEVRSEIEQDGAAAVRSQPVSGIPYKVYASEAGIAGVSVGPWIVQSVAARGARIVTVGFVLTAIGVLARRLRRFYPIYLAVLAVGFAGVLALALYHWR